MREEQEPPTTREQLEDLLRRRNEAWLTCRPLKNGFQAEAHDLERRRKQFLTVKQVEAALAGEASRALDFCGAAGLLQLSGRGWRGPLLTSAGEKLLAALRS